MYYKKSRSTYYNGIWSHGQRHGTGVLVYASGAQYSGEWRHDAKTGTGTMTWPHLQQAYVGQWKHNKQHGIGTHVWGVSAAGPLQPMSTQAVSNRYEGGFKHGLRHGVGTFYYADGGSYFGGWRRGLKHGHGVLTTADGRVIQGQFCSDELPAAAASGMSLTTGGSSRRSKGPHSSAVHDSMALTGTPSQPLAPSMGLHVGDLLPSAARAPAAAAEHTRALNSIMMKWNSQLHSVYALYSQVNAKDAAAMGRVAGVFPPTGHALLGLAGTGADDNLLGAAAVQSMTLGDLWTFCLEAGLVRPPITLAFVDSLLHLARMRHAVCLAEAAHTVQSAETLRRNRRAEGAALTHAEGKADMDVESKGGEGGLNSPSPSMVAALRSASPPGSGRGGASLRMGDAVVSGGATPKRRSGGVTLQADSKLGDAVGQDEAAAQEGESLAAALLRLDEGEDSDGGSSYASSASSECSVDSSPAEVGNAGPALSLGKPTRPSSGTPRRRPASAARGAGGAPAIVAEAQLPVGAAADAYEALVFARRHAAEQPVLYREFLEVIVRLAALTAGGAGGVEYGVLSSALGNHAQDTDASSEAGLGAGPADVSVGAAMGGAMGPVAPLPSLVGSRWGASSMAPPGARVASATPATTNSLSLRGGSALLPGHNVGVGNASVALVRQQQAPGGGSVLGGYAYPGAGAWSETASTLTLGRHGLSLQGTVDATPSRPGCTLREPPTKALPGAVASMDLTAASRAGGVAQRGGGGAPVPAIRSHFDALPPGVLSLADALDAFAWGVLKPLLAREQQRAAQRDAAVAQAVASAGTAGASFSVPARPASHSPMSARRAPLTPQATPPSPQASTIHRPASWHSNWGSSADLLPSAGGCAAGPKGGLPMWLQPRLHVTGLRAALRNEDVVICIAEHMVALRALFVRYSSVDRSVPLMPGSADGDGPLMGAAATSTPQVQLEVQQDAGARVMTAGDVARCLGDARLLDACFTAQHVVELCMAAAFGDAAAPAALGHELWADGVGGTLLGGAGGGADGTLSEGTPLDEVDEEDDEEEGEGVALHEDTGISDERLLHVSTAGGAGMQSAFPAVPLSAEGGLQDYTDGDDAVLQAAQLSVLPLPALAGIPVQPVPLDAHSWGVQLLFPQFLEALVRVCLAQYSVAVGRAEQAKVVADHAAAVAAAKAEAARLQALAAEAAAAASSKGGKGGKKKSKDAAAAEAAALEPRVDLSVLGVPPPTPAAHVVLDKPAAPLAHKWSHFLQHTLLRRHKLGGVGQEDMAATLAEEGGL